MPSLPEIRNTCLETLAIQKASAGWPSDYAASVPPVCVLELTDWLEKLLAHADVTAPVLAAQVRSALYPKVDTPLLRRQMRRSD